MKLLVLWLGELGIDGYEWMRELYASSVLVRATIESMLVLAAVILIDAAIGFQSGMDTLYIAPIWLAAHRGGRSAGMVAVAATDVSQTFLDYNIGLIAGWQIVLNLALRGVVFLTLMHLIESLESRLQKYSRLANRDSLTGCATRTALEQFASRAINRCRGREPLAIAMVDCDRFKQLNDQYGHSYGDSILNLLGRLLRKGVLPRGLAARTGGDEFVIVLPGKTALEAKWILERQLSRFTSDTDTGVGAASFSYGVAELTPHIESLSKLVETADRDMYLRKRLRASSMAVVEGAAGAIPA